MSATANQPTMSWIEPVIAGAAAEVRDPTLGADLLVHMDAQLASARHLMHIVLTQAAAIRRRAVREVVTAAGELQVEMHRRELLEYERMQLMRRAAALLAVAPENVGFTSIQQLLDPETAALAGARTAELGDLLVTIDREHKLNRALMSQELAFLDHLLGLAGGSGGYVAEPARRGAGGPGGNPGEPARIRRNAGVARKRVFDLEA